MGWGSAPAGEISFVSLVAYGPNSDSALTMGGYSLWNQAGQFPTRYYITTRMAEIVCTHIEQMQMVHPLWKTLWQFSYKLVLSYKLNGRVYLPFNSAISLLGIYPREIKHMPTERLYMNFYNSFIWSSQKPETTQMSLDK